MKHQYISTAELKALLLIPAADSLLKLKLKNVSIDESELYWDSVHGSWTGRFPSLTHLWLERFDQRSTGFVGMLRLAGNQLTMVNKCTGLDYTGET